jgi:Holliday junction resolvasome RuvABC ATP-dependent DNA helicase subunit
MIKFNELLECDKDIKNSIKRKKKKKNAVPWVDKYRPTKLSEVVYQDDVIKMLKRVLETGNMPHLLFYGSSGTGKCLHPDTPIIMYNGVVRSAKQIQINDLLMGDYNLPIKVLST